MGGGLTSPCTSALLNRLLVETSWMSYFSVFFVLEIAMLESIANALAVIYMPGGDISTLRLGYCEVAPSFFFYSLHSTRGTVPYTLTRTFYPSLRCRCRGPRGVLPFCLRPTATAQNSGVYWTTEPSPTCSTPSWTHCCASKNAKRVASHVRSSSTTSSPTASLLEVAPSAHLHRPEGAPVPTF